jgi:hypothetical protein
MDAVLTLRRTLHRHPPPLVRTRADRRALVRMWRATHIDRRALAIELLTTILKREPQLFTVFSFGNASSDTCCNTGVLSRDTRFVRHAMALVSFVDTTITHLARNDTRAIIEHSLRLGRRHASILNGRCVQVRAAWWTVFATSLFDVLLPYTAIRGAKMLILWHMFVTRVVEYVALGFLATHVENASGGGTNAMLMSAMPTIYEQAETASDAGTRRSSPMSRAHRSTVRKTCTFDESVLSSCSIMPCTDVPTVNSGRSASITAPITDLNNNRVKTLLPCADESRLRTRLLHLLHLARSPFRASSRTTGSGTSAERAPNDDDAATYRAVSPATTDPLPRKHVSGSCVQELRHTEHVIMLQTMEEWDQV